MFYALIKTKSAHEKLQSIKNAWSKDEIWRLEMAALLTQGNSESDKYRFNTAFLTGSDYYRYPRNCIFNRAVGGADNVALRKGVPKRNFVFKQKGSTLAVCCRQRLSKHSADNPPKAVLRMHIIKSVFPRFRRGHGSQNQHPAFSVKNGRNAVFNMFVSHNLILSQRR